jgi:dTDP-4-amino-4,6-dideoxygalactose transaminase
MIPFNVPPFCPGAEARVHEAIASHKICGDGEFTKRCHAWLETQTGTSKALLTTSGTHALEMAALLCGLEPGDEVILPSYTFSSTANAFVLAGARLVFVDIRPDTMNIDEKRIEEAITPKTRVICVMHYAGVSCAMDEIMDIARRHDLLVVEDAAQAVMSQYKGRPLGSIGDFGCYSFHETKNYSMGEGGALLVRDDDGRAEIIREKGTNRSQFFRGMVDKYTWVDYGSSYLPSELNAAYLYGQLEIAQQINQARLDAWARYYQQLSGLEQRGCIQLAHIPAECTHNAHMFWIKSKDLAERTALIAFLKEKGVNAVFHYVPLHSAPAGLRFGRFHGQDVYTTAESDRLVRLPMYYGITPEIVAQAAQAVADFYKK